MCMAHAYFNLFPKARCEMWVGLKYTFYSLSPPLESGSEWRQDLHMWKSFCRRRPLPFRPDMLSHPSSLFPSQCALHTSPFFSQLWPPWRRGNRNFFATKVLCVETDLPPEINPRYRLILESSKIYSMVMEVNLAYQRFDVSDRPARLGWKPMRYTTYRINSTAGMSQKVWKRQGIAKLQDRSRKVCMAISYYSTVTFASTADT